MFRFLPVNTRKNEDGTGYPAGGYPQNRQLNMPATGNRYLQVFRNVKPENIQDMLDLRTADRLGGGARETSWRLELFKKRLIEVQKQPFTVSDLKIDGHDVMKIYKTGPGPLVGKVLDMVFNDVIAGKLPNEREILLSRITNLKKEMKI